MTDTAISSPPPAFGAVEGYQRALQQTLGLAMNHHQSGQLREAEQLYRAVLQAEPEHAQANHHLGVLMVETEQPAALQHFEAALAADPESARYWISYIRALAYTGQFEHARQMLALGKEHGLDGDAVEELAQTLSAGPQTEA